MISGHITICKIYDDGYTEVVLDQANMITAGLGAGICDLLSYNGSVNLDNYRPGYFQIGTSAMGVPSTDTSSYFYHLSSPMSWENYGVDSNLDLEQLKRGFFASTTDSVVTPNSEYEEMLFTSALLSSVLFSGTTSGNHSYFSKTNNASITKWYFDSLESEIVIDETTGNGQTITEIGLFARNPKGYTKDIPLLVAYKSFTGIPKTSEFSLVFHWTIGFIGMSSTIDTKFHPNPRNDNSVDIITYTER
jgi:hypothetical protein